MMDRWDYLIFAGLTVAGLLLLHVLLPKFRPRLYLPLEVCVFCLAVIGFGWLTVNAAGNAERERARRQITDFMPAFAHDIAELEAAWWKSSSPPTPETETAFHFAQQISLKANSEIVATAIYRKTPDGTFQLVSQYPRSKVAAPLLQPSPGLRKAQRGQLNIEDPGNGTSNLQGWAPILDEQRRVMGAFGMEYSPVHLSARVKFARLSRIGGLALVMLIGAAAILVITVLRDDLNALREVESRLRYSEERLWLHFHQAPLAIMENLPDGTIAAWNPAAERIFGYSTEEIIGRAGDFFVAAKDRERVRQIFHEVVLHHKSIQNVNDNITKDGRTITCEWHNTPLINAAGEVIGVTSIVQDITVRLKLEEDLRLSQRIQSVGQLAAGIAHDYNNLLTIIQGRADMIRDRNELPKRSATDLEQISTAAERAAGLTRQLLTFSRRQVMLPTPQNANEIMSGVAALLRQDLPENIALKCHFTPALPLLMADRKMLTHALMNLAMNAIEAMPVGGELLLKTGLVHLDAPDLPPMPRPASGWALTMEVIDNGVGVEPEKLTRLFEPFFTTKDVGEGPGLGLPVVHGIVEEHGGAIRLASQPGEGTTATIFLPARSAPAPEERFVGSSPVQA